MPDGGGAPSRTIATWVADGTVQPIVTCPCDGSWLRHVNDVGALKAVTSGPPWGVVTVGGDVVGGGTRTGMGRADDDADDDPVAPEQAPRVTPKRVAPSTKASQEHPRWRRTCWPSMFPPVGSRRTSAFGGYQALVSTTATTPIVPMMARISITSDPKAATSTAKQDRADNGDEGKPHCDRRA